MQIADAEQWAGIAALVAWSMVALASVAGRLPHLGRLPRPVVAATGIAALLFLSQAMVVDAIADRPGIPAADESTLQWMLAHRAPVPTAVFEEITYLGGTVGMLGLATAAAVALVLARRRWEALVVVVTAAGGELLTDALKDFYQRPRPPDLTRLTVATSYSLPSGHSLVSVVALGIMAAVGVHLLHRTAARVAVVGLAGVLAVAIGVSRLYLGVHWLTDVLDGWLLGGTWLALCTAALVCARGQAIGPWPPPVPSGPAPQ
ncbi:phosphatase PAP2 family protein [Pseudonocardia sp. DLS-67]